MNWKNFDLQLFFQGVAGNKIYNQLRHRLEGTGTNSVLSPVMKNAWMQHTNDAGETYYDGSIPNPKNSVNYYVSDRFLENGSYFRDPEVGGGVDYGNYPQARSFIFGANISF